MLGAPGSIGRGADAVMSSVVQANDWRDEECGNSSAADTYNSHGGLKEILVETRRDDMAHYYQGYAFSSILFASGLY